MSANHVNESVGTTLPFRPIGHTDISRPGHVHSPESLALYINRTKALSDQQPTNAFDHPTITAIDDNTQPTVDDYHAKTVGKKRISKWLSEHDVEVALSVTSTLIILGTYAIAKTTGEANPEVATMYVAASSFGLTSVSVFSPAFVRTKVGRRFAERSQLLVEESDFQSKQRNAAAFEAGQDAPARKRLKVKEEEAIQRLETIRSRQAYRRNGIHGEALLR